MCSYGTCRVSQHFWPNCSLTYRQILDQHVYQHLADLSIVTRSSVGYDYQLTLGMLVCNWPTACPLGDNHLSAASWLTVILLLTMSQYNGSFQKLALEEVAVSLPYWSLWIAAPASTCTLNNAMKYNVSLPGCSLGSCDQDVLASPTVILITPFSRPLSPLPKNK